MDGSHEDARREAARLRYELARLRDRRTVRAALAVTDLRRAGPRAALAALRGRSPRLDVPGPDRVPLRPVFPHLRAVCTGSGELLASTAIHERITPTTATTTLDRDRPDLLLVDGVRGWTAPELAGLRAAARERGLPVVTLGPEAAAALPDAELRVAGSAPVQGAGLEVGAVVDVRTWSPVGLDDATPAHLSDEAAVLTPVAARRQPVVAVPEVAAMGHRRCLELLAAGAVVVTGPDARLRAALAGSGGEDLVIAEHHREVEHRVDRLLGDDDLRRRVSVRLRRHVHRHWSTRAALVAITSALGWDAPPDERISVLLATRRPERLVEVAEDLAGQRHVTMELLVLPHGDAPLPDRLPGVDRVVRVPAERPLGAVLNVGLDAARGRYCAKVDDDDRYGRDHLGDQLLALHHSGAELVGRRVHGIYDEVAGVTLHPDPGGEERFEDHLPGGTLLLEAATLRQVRWRNVPNNVDGQLVRAIHLHGGSVYSGHRYGYIRVRHGDHTYDPRVAWQGSQVPGLDTGLLEA